MNLSTASPYEIDTIIADLETCSSEQTRIITAYMDKFHQAAGDRRHHGHWKMRDSEALEKVRATVNDPAHAVRFLIVGGQEKIRKDLTAHRAAHEGRELLDAEIARYEGEYRRRPWTRFFQLRSTAAARIHDTRHCQGLHRSDLSDLGWHPELSGKTEEEAVAELGPVMCSKCFPSAPAEWRQDPKDLKPVNPNA